MSELCKCGHPMAVHGPAGCMAYVAAPGSESSFCGCKVRGLGVNDWDFSLRDRLWIESQGGTATEPTPCPDCARKDALLNSMRKDCLEYIGKAATLRSHVALRDEQIKQKDALLKRAKTALRDCVDELATIEDPQMEGEDGRDVESLPAARTLLADIKEQG
jgi:hypothetical protein